MNFYDISALVNSENSLKNLEKSKFRNRIMKM